MESFHRRSELEHKEVDLSYIVGVTCIQLIHSSHPSKDTDLSYFFSLSDQFDHDIFITFLFPLISFQFYYTIVFCTLLFVAFEEFVLFCQRRLQCCCSPYTILTTISLINFYFFAISILCDDINCTRQGCRISLCMTLWALGTSFNPAQKFYLFFNLFLICF